MKRTHVMHKRDNRRSYPSHQAGPRDDGRDSRALAWRRAGERQVLELDGKPVASIEPDAARQDENWFAHVAIIECGPKRGERIACEDCDAARLACEAAFANGGAA